MPAKLTVVPNEAREVEFTAKSGRVFTLKALTGYEMMMADELAMTPEGAIRVMRIPYLRSLASIKAIDGVAFGPLRTDIDVQKWSSHLSESEMDELMQEHQKRASATDKADLKNE